eukprot:403861-Lingulodinium_polyedra.AAC.1
MQAVAQGLVVRQAGKEYGLSRLTVVRQRGHRIPAKIISPAELLHRAAKDAATRLAGQRWDSGLFAFV